MRTDIRNNERAIFDDTTLAGELFGRVAAKLPSPLAGMSPVGANERFRCYRYKPGMKFGAHYDGAFERDEVEANGQRFLFRPRPARPPIIVGGAPPHAIHRAVRFGDGWMPTAMHADVLESGMADLRAGMAAAGKPALVNVVTDWRARATTAPFTRYTT